MTIDQKIAKKLCEWEDNNIENGKYIGNPLTLSWRHSFIPSEIYYKSDEDGLGVYDWFDAQLSYEDISIEDEVYDDIWEGLEKQFIHFGYTGEGGNYFLWDYEGRDNNDMPVVFLGGDGEYDMLASSLNDFVCLIASGKVYSSDDKFSLKELGIRSWEDMSQYRLDDFTQEEYAEDCKKFMDFLKEDLECKSYEEVVKNVKQQKNFKNFINKWLAEIAIEFSTISDFRELKDIIYRKVSIELIDEKYIKILESRK